MLGNIAQRLPRLWARVANLNELPGNFIAPIVVGYLLTHSDLNAVFLMFALVSLFGAVTVSAFAIETREKVLEEVSP